MTETKWTPGPWENQGEDYFADMPFIRIGVGGRLIGEALPPIGADAIENEMRANANLMAAAPDLYAATDWDWLIELENESLDDDQGGDNDFPIKLTVGQIRALMRARRKARGE